MIIFLPAGSLANSTSATTTSSVSKWYRTCTSTITKYATSSCYKTAKTPTCTSTSLKGWKAWSPPSASTNTSPKGWNAWSPPPASKNAALAKRDEVRTVTELCAGYTSTYTTGCTPARSTHRRAHNAALTKWKTWTSTITTTYTSTPSCTAAAKIRGAHRGMFQ